MDVRNEACKLLLSHRVEQKMSGKKVPLTPSSSSLPSLFGWLLLDPDPMQCYHSFPRRYRAGFRV